jgi:hypothetical protein
MDLTVGFAEPADPAGAWIVTPVPPEVVMDLMDQLQGELFVTLLPGNLSQAKKVAYRESIRPKVTPW